MNYFQNPYLFGIAASILAISIVIMLLRKGSLKERHAILWLLAGILTLVISIFPSFFASIAASLNGDLASARKLHYDLLPITKLFFTEGNPGGVKIALEELEVDLSNAARCGDK